MDAYLQALEKNIKSKPDILQDIWNKLDGIRYGMWDNKTNTPIYMDTKKIDKRQTNEYLYQNCRILSPKELLEKKVGTCWGITITICYLSNLHKLPYQTYYYEAKNNKGEFTATHMVPTIQYKNQWHMIEHVYGKLYGIHSCKTVQECWNIQDKMRLSKGEKIVYKNTNFANKLAPLFNDKNITIQKIINITGTVI